MTIEGWVEELDSKINHSLVDNVEYIKLHIDDLIELNDCIKEYLSIDRND